MDHLNLPLNERDVKKLKLGQVLSVSGPIVTGRDELHIRALERAKDGGEIPKILTGATLYHCGPIMKKEGDAWIVLAAGPTTSARMNKLEAEFIRRFRIRAIIGKGGMSEEVAQAMKESGCVYLAATGCKLCPSGAKRTKPQTKRLWLSLQAIFAKKVCNYDFFHF